jgi:flagellin-like protein
MNVKNLFTDEDAVSPVIGVILMVAITVILAAVIGAFVLNIGGSQDTAPSVSFDFEQSSAGVDVTVQSASESIDEANWNIEPEGLSYSDSKPATLSSGTTFTVINGTGNVYDGFNIVWESSSSDQTSIIGSYDG